MNKLEKKAKPSKLNKKSLKNTEPLIDKTIKEELKVKIKKEIVDELENRIGFCENEGCKESGYMWDHENGDEYIVCPYHFMEGLHCELGKVIRDYLPIGQWTQKKQDFINEIRGEVNGFLGFNMNRYFYCKKVEKDIEKQNK